MKEIKAKPQGDSWMKPGRRESPGARQEKSPGAKMAARDVAKKAIRDSLTGKSPSSSKSDNSNAEPKDSAASGITVSFSTNPSSCWPEPSQSSGKAANTGREPPGGATLDTPSSSAANQSSYRSSQSRPSGKTANSDREPSNGPASGTYRSFSPNPSSNRAEAGPSSGSTASGTGAAPQGGKSSAAHTFSSQPVYSGKKQVNRSYDRNASRATPKEKGKPGIKAFSHGVKQVYKGAKTVAASASSATSTMASAPKSDPEREATDRLAEQSKKAAKKAAEAAAKQSAKLAVKATKKVVKWLIEAAIEVGKTLVAAVGIEGAAIVVVVIAVAAVALLLLSPFGILVGGGANNTPTIPDVVQTLNGELSDEISQIQKNIHHDKVVVAYTNDDIACIENWPDILAVFAVEAGMNAENPMDVVEMDSQRISMLRKVFWDMVIVTSDITEEPSTSTPSPSPSPGSTATASPTAPPKQILTIHVYTRDWEDMVDDYAFSDEQKQTLQELMSAKYFTLLELLADSASSESGSDGGPAKDWSSIIDVPKGGMDIPLYMQHDYPKTVCYIDGVAKSVASSGCGAASTSMVIAYLTGNTDQTPYTLFKWANANGYYSGNGLSHGCLTKLASLYGVKGTWIENDAQKITEALKAGHPVIAHMGPGIFTSSGHYIVLRGVTDDGYVLVNDPGFKKKNKYAYKLSTVVSQARRADSFMVCELQ